MINNFTPSNLLDRYIEKLLGKLEKIRQSEIDIINQEEDELLSSSKKIIEEWIQRINSLILLLEQEFESSWEMKLGYLCNTFGFPTVIDKQGDVFFDVRVIVRMWDVAIASYQNRANYELSRVVWKYYEMRKIVWEFHSKKQGLVLDIHNNPFGGKLAWLIFVHSKISDVNKQMSKRVGLILES